MSLKKKAVSGLFWTFAQQFGTQGVSFVVSIVLARILLPKEFGIIGMISIFMGIGMSLMNSGLSQSLIRTENPTQEDYATVFYFNLAGSVIIYFILFFSAPLIALFFSQPILTPIVRLYCLTFIISAFSQIQLTKLTKEMEFKIQMTIAIPSIVISGIFGIILAYLGYGVWSLVWMSLCQAFLNSVQLWIKSKWTPSFIFDKSKFRYHFKFGYKLMFSGLLDTFFTNIYQVIIGRYFVAAEVGFYTRAVSFRQLPLNNLSGALNKISYPLFASIKDDDIRLKKAYKEIMRMVIFVVAPILIFMAVLAQPLFRLLFTERWLPAVPYFQILCIAGILYPFHAYNLNILNVKGRSDLFLKLEIIKKILVLIIIFVTIQFGVIGLIWGQVVNSFLAFFINTHYSGKFLQYTAWQQLKDTVPLIIFALIAGGIVWIFDNQFHNYKDIYRILAGGIVGVVIYFAIAIFLKLDSFLEIKKIILKR